jgi:hypothetical protein
MKRNFLLFAAALALLVTTAASAQTIGLKVSVPFSFIVNRSTLPAGEYSVQSVDDQGRVLAIRGLTTKTANLVISNSCQTMKPVSQTKLFFHRYGDRYFLNRIWVGGMNAGHELPANPREREVAKDFSMQEVVLMAKR